LIESQFETINTTNTSNENYQQLIDSKNKTIQTLEVQLATKQRENNEMVWFAIFKNNLIRGAI
jgi:hypothetical protein